MFFNDLKRNSYIVKGRGVNFQYLLWRGGSEKLKKGGEIMVQGQVLLKVERVEFFKVYHFYILKLLYPLQNCVLHLKKNYFFLPP